MEALGRIIGAIAIPLVFLNLFGGIASGIWLAFLGEWDLIGYGLLLIIVSGFSLGIAMAPGMIFALPAAKMLESGNKLGHVFGLLAMAYTMLVITAWCIFAIVFCLKRIEPDALFPALIWAYGIGTAPVSFLAQKDAQAGNDAAAFTTFFVQIALLASITSIYFLEVTLAGVLGIFAVVMTVSVVIQYADAMQRESASRRGSW